MPQCEFTLKQSRAVTKKGEQFSVSIDPPLRPGCTWTLKVNGADATMAGKNHGDVRVNGLAHGYVSLEALKDNPRAVLTAKVTCKDPGCGPTEQNLQIGDFTAPVQPEESVIDEIVKKAVGWLTGIKDFLGGAIDKLTPEGLKSIKELISKGLDAVVNLIPNLPLPVPGPIPLFGGLSISMEKIGKILKGLDPVDNSPEAVAADVKALQALIDEELIPFVRLVGQAAKLDHEAYRRRYALISKLLELSTRDLNHLQSQTKKARKRK